jgi:hypothetical protein
VSRVRPVDLARLALGATALARPQRLLRGVGADDATATQRVTQVLGARYAVQSGAGLLRPRPWEPRADGVVDLLHAGSMVGLAAVSERHRRAALTSAALALAFAAADLRRLAR